MLYETVLFTVNDPTINYFCAITIIKIIKTHKYSHDVRNCFLNVSNIDPPLIGLNVHTRKKIKISTLQVHPFLFISIVLLKFSLSMRKKSLISALFYAYNILSKTEYTLIVLRSKGPLYYLT